VLPSGAGTLAESLASVAASAHCATAAISTTNMRLYGDLMLLSAGAQAIL